MSIQPIITTPTNVSESHEWFLHPTETYEYISLIGRMKLIHRVTFSWARMSSRFELYFDGVLETVEEIGNVFGTQVIYWNDKLKPDEDIHESGDPVYDPETRLLHFSVNGRRWAVGPNAIEPYDDLKQFPIEHQFKDWLDERQYYYAKGLVNEYNQKVSQSA